jgi:hypothetical protein
LILKKVLYSVDLTVKNNRNGGFYKDGKDVTRKEMQTALKACIQSIRQKAILRNWECIIYPVISNTSISRGGRKSRWHIHILVYGTPCNVICREIKAYWTSHGYANATHCPVKKCWDGGKLSYNQKQVTGNPRLLLINYDLTDENIGTVNKQNVLRFFASYTPPKVNN